MTSKSSSLACNLKQRKVGTINLLNVNYLLQFAKEIVKSDEVSATTAVTRNSLSLFCLQTEKKISSYNILFKVISYVIILISPCHSFAVR